MPPYQIVDPLVVNNKALPIDCPIPILVYTTPMDPEQHVPLSPTHLQDLVKNQTILTETELLYHFRTLSKQHHPDTGKTDGRAFSQLLQDRDRAKHMLSDTKRDPGNNPNLAPHGEPQDFWEIFHRYTLQENPKEQPSSLYPPLLIAAQGISQDLGQAIEVFNRTYRKPADLNIDRTARFFFLGLANLFSYLSSRSDRDKTLATGYLQDCMERLGRKTEQNKQGLKPLCQWLLSHGFE